MEVRLSDEIKKETGKRKIIVKRQRERKSVPDGEK